MSNRKICPVMSRPVVQETNMGANMSVYWVSCEEHNCAWWDDVEKSCQAVETPINIGGGNS